MFEKNTPRDFFLHAGAFISLYLGAIALITLVFNVINYSFPDPINGYYSDPYSGPMRFAIASLVILTPLCVYLFFLIQGSARQNPERRTLGVRKWLTYITLFIAGATVIGDLIILMDSFLGGTLPNAFLLKVLTILVILGAGFGYFLLDIKEYWMKNAAQSRLVGMGTVCVVLLSIVGGVFLMGSPQTQRELRVDAIELQDMQMLASGILNYWQQTRTLPPDLETLNNDLSGYRVPTAPESQPAYTYEKTGDLSFKLCATFLQSSFKAQNTAMFQDGFIEGPQWDHQEGHTCFTRTIDPKLFTPTVNIAPAPLEVPIKK